MSSPVAALITRIWRSWTSMRTRVRAWVRPMPMWESLPSWRRVSLPVDVDAVGADPVVAGGAGLARDGLGPGVAGDSWGLAVRQGPVRAAGVVVAGEGVQ